MILQFKSYIYRYTGIYLAHKEELEYLSDDKLWNDMELRLKAPDNDMSLANWVSVEIGMWQACHGFCRPMVSWTWKYRNVLFGIPASLVNSAVSIWWDLKSLISKMLSIK